MDDAAAQAVLDDVVVAVTNAVPPPDWYGERLFGGFVLGHLVHRAASAAPEGKRLTSMHGHFLRAMRAGVPVTFREEDVKSGRTVCVRRVESLQDGAAVFSATCQYMADVAGGYEYELAPEEAPPPARSIEEWPDRDAFDNRWVGPTELRADGTYRLSHRAWMSLGGTIADDPALHAAMVAYLSDMTGPGSRPLLLEPDIAGIVSLDHAIWFHRPPRFDGWLYYELECSVNHGGRSFVRGTMRSEDQHLVASFTQELIVTPPG